MNGSLTVVDDVPGEFAERVVEAFLGRPNDGFALVLTGGPAARACYERLAADGATQIDWWKVDVYWADERCGSPDDPASNYRLGREALLDRVGAANATFPMRCAEGPDPYQLRVGELGRFDVLHLDLRPDGGVAGLLPGSPALDADPGRLVVMHDAGPGTEPRMTLTYTGIARARLVLVTAVGEANRDALRGALRGDPAVPAAAVRGERLVWLADPAAAGDGAA
jgi:6-phosphogluconolactonase